MVSLLPCLGSTDGVVSDGTGVLTFDPDKGFGRSLIQPVTHRIEQPFHNRLHSVQKAKHLLSVDDRAHGADGGAPEVRSVVRLHGDVVAPRDGCYPEPGGNVRWETSDDFEPIPDSPVACKQAGTCPNGQDPTTL